MRALFKAMPCLLALALPWHVPAQAATIDGIVAEQGKPVADAELMLVNADTSQIIKSLYSAADGRFRFSVKPGNYNVGALKSGYTMVWNKGIAIKHSDITLSIELVDQAFADGPLKTTSGDCE